jgi:hypothetical protein
MRRHAKIVSLGFILILVAACALNVHTRARVAMMRLIARAVFRDSITTLLIRAARCAPKTA